MAPQLVLLYYRRFAMDVLNTAVSLLSLFKTITFSPDYEVISRHFLRMTEELHTSQQSMHLQCFVQERLSFVVSGLQLRTLIL